MVPIELENSTEAIGTTSRVSFPWFHALWLLLLIGEVSALSLTFDVNTPAVASQPSLIVRSLARSSSLVRLGISVGAVIATVLLTSVALRQELARTYRETASNGHSRWFLAVHVLAFAILFWSTGRLLAGIRQSTDQVVPVLLWVGCGAVTLGSWMLAALPLAFWSRVLKRTWKVLLAGFLIGLAALQVSSSTGRLWLTFHGWTFESASAVLRLLRSDVVCHPESRNLGTSDFAVNISLPCSGYEGIGLIWAFLGGYLVLYRRELRFPQALLLLPIGTVIIWGLNIFRIVGLILVGSWGWPKVALGGFHSQAGWLAFNLVGLGLVAASRRLHLFARQSATLDSGSSDFINPTAEYLGPLLAVIATTMVTGALSDGVFDSYYAARVLVAVVSLWYCRRVFRDWKWTWSVRAIAFGVLVFVIWNALEPLAASGDSAASEMPRALRVMSPPRAALWMAARLVGTVITVPVIEELAYRGYLLRRLIAADFQAVPYTRFTWSSFLISSIIFGAMHQQRWLAGTVAGMLYAVAVRRGGRLSDGVLAHATTNALIAGVVLTTGSWSLWS